MTLEIRYLKLRINTSDGPYGVEIPFTKGLFIIHADNTSGKSTCLQAIIYALGLEGMLSPSHDIPLPPVVTEALEFDGETHNVLESEVLIEISNGRDIITIRRPIKGSQDRRLVTVWDGEVLSQPTTSRISRDYFVRQKGSASRERGFHHFLANFIGWDLPTVPTFDEGETLLYMEAIFPLIFVEQKHGWSNLRNRFPTYLKIKDLSRRVFEFLMCLDAQEIATRKIFLKQQVNEVKSIWRFKVEECSRLTAVIDATLSDLPVQPIAAWPPSILPQILISLNNEWINAGQLVLDLEEELLNLENLDIPQVEESADHVSEELKEKEEDLANLEIRMKHQVEDFENQAMQVESLRARIAALREEFQRNRDLKKLADLGSTQELRFTSGVCPTCDQEISESLISSEAIQETMSVDQNIEFIREQISIFEAMLSSEISDLELKRRQLSGARNLALNFRQDIRALKTTLTSQSNAPSYAAIERRIRIAEKIRRVNAVSEQVDFLLADFSELSEQWNTIQDELSRLPGGILSDQDIQKIRSLEMIFRYQLNSYEFRSLNPDEIDISRNTYFPEYDGFDLQYDASASDYIRIMWAYLLGLLEVARDFSTNHLGLLILDEPRQQSAQLNSTQAFLERASAAREHDQQIIVATSESEDVLAGILHNLSQPYNYIRFDGRIIAPV